MSLPVLLIPETDGDESGYECTSYEKDADGTLRLYVEGQLLVTISADEWDVESALCFFDPDEEEFLDVTDIDEDYRAYLVKVH